MYDSSTPLYLNNLSFEKAINSQLALIDFWAEWCAPCRMQSPILDDLAREMGNKVVIGKLNVDDNRSIAAKYGIMSIPTLMIFQHGKPVKTLVGVQSLERLKRELLSLLQN